MKYSIRKIRHDEVRVLDTFLYEAIFVPVGFEAPTRDIIKEPELQVYVDGFGSKTGDLCFVAEAEGQIIGAVWVRIMEDYGHVDDETPSLAISLLKDYRGCGIGSELMERMIEELRTQGYRKVSLSVQKTNYAVRLYKKAGFEVSHENEEEYIMICHLQ